MKGMLLLILFFLTSVFFVFDDLSAQSTFGPVRAKYSRDIYNSSTVTYSNGLYDTTLLRQISIGKYSTARKRAVFQWEIPDNMIPDGSTINSVTIKFRFSVSQTQPIPVKFFNVGVDIVNPNLNSLWDLTDPSKQSDIGTAEGTIDPGFPSTGTVEITFPNSSAMANAIAGSLSSNKFILGVIWKYESPDAGNIEWPVYSNIYMTINYEPKRQTVIVDQKLSNGNSYGNIELFEGNLFQKYPAPRTFSLYVNSDQYFRADTNKATVADEKFNQWNYDNTDAINHKTLTIKDGMNSLTANFSQTGTATLINALEGSSSVSGDMIDFKDPWLRDDDSDSKGLRNRGSGAIWHSHTSPFIQNISDQRFKGVLLNQLPNTSNIYSARAKQTFDVDLPQTGKTHKFYFQNWTATNASVSNPTSLETPVVFTANNSEVLANYKGTQLSNTQSAFSNSSQRKFIRTPDGYYHLVYESMNKIWYERSTNGGVSWTLQNNGKPLNTDYVYISSEEVSGSGSYTVAKEPSIDYYQNKILIVWEEQSGSNYIVRLAIMNNALPSSIPIGQANEIPFQSYGLYSEDIYPEIAAKDEGHAVIAIHRNDSMFKGLEVHYITLGNLDYGRAKELCSSVITGTNQNTGTFTLATDRSGSDKYHIAWQEILSLTTISMNYAKFNYSWVPGETFAISSGSAAANVSTLPGDPGHYMMNQIETVNVLNSTSYIRCYSPTMFGVSDGTARLAFKGYRSTFYGGIYSVSSCCPDNLSWIPYLRKYSDEVFSPQISPGSETYFVGWTEYYGGIYRTISTDASTLSDLEAVNGSSGRDMQINSGGTRFQQFSMSFNSERSTVPYTFSRSDAIGLIEVNKKLEISSGRGIFLTKGESQIYFILGDVVLDGMNINFIKAMDTVRLDGDIKKVNSYLITEPFSLKDNSTLTFAAVYGVKDSSISEARMKEGDFASFQLELVDDASGRVLGNYLDERINKGSIFSLKESAFRINPEGVGNRLVRLRVSVKENMKSQYTISDMFLGSGIKLSKSLKEKELGLNGSLEVKEYSLSQNYPNPFNPTTLISYALPKASKVSLKIYDILGKEVAALVNEVKEKGKYSVEFNASSLPSGIYIYEIRANDFVKSSKMLLLK